jgi:subtilisin-like proprotein convertase family protein
MKQTQRILTAALATLMPSLAYAQDYECSASLGTNCRAAINDGSTNNSGVNITNSTSSTLTVLPGACDPKDVIVDVDLSVQLLHPFVGDLEIALTHPDGTSVVVLYQPGLGVIDGTCPNDDMDVTFDDDDGTSDASMCNAQIPAMSGAIIPFNPLSVFKDKPRNGNWTLTVRDHAAGQEGVLTGWTLHLPCVPDLPDVTLDAIDGTLSERGEDDSATVRVTRGGSTKAALEVQYVVTGTASLEDFEPLSGKVTIPAGKASADIDISAVEDDINELDETIVLTLLPGSSYDVAARDSATVTLVEQTKVGGAGNGGAGNGGGGNGNAGNGGGDGSVDENPDGGVADGGADGGSGKGGDGGDCGCRIAGGSRSPSLLVTGLAFALGAILLRRRRR